MFGSEVRKVKRNKNLKEKKIEVIKKKKKNFYVVWYVERKKIEN